MTTTPKSVILAVVVTLGLIALAVVVGAIVLQATGNGALPGEVLAIGAGAAGAVGGVLASTRTTPELPPGAQLTGGATTLTTPTTAQNVGDAPLVTQSVGVVGVPVAPRVPAGPAVPVDTSALVTLEQQGIDPTLGHPASADYPKNLNASGG